MMLPFKKCFEGRSLEFQSDMSITAMMAKEIVQLDYDYFRENY